MQEDIYQSNIHTRVAREALTREKLQAIAKIRLRESKILLNSGSYSGAYYLCGYAVECGLKACIAKNFKRYVFPDKEFVNNCYSHSLENLIGLADLTSDFRREKASDPYFDINWATIKDWKETSRYEEHDGVEARDLYNAISSRNHGVMRWVKRHW